MKIVIIGAGGRLGAALAREYRDSFDVASFNHAQLDLSNLDKIREKLGETDFDVLINAAAFTNVDLCEAQREHAFLINAEAPRILAEICGDKNAKLIHFSTDYVFDGEKRAPYTEEDEANPISIYGESKLNGEKNALAAQNGHLVVRVSWVFGPDRPSFIDAMIKRAQEHETVDAIADKFSTPTYTYDIARMLPQFFEQDVESGILHFANAGKCSWQEYAQWALDCCRESGVPAKARTVGALTLKDMARLRQGPGGQAPWVARLRQGPGGQAPWVARRPVYSVLSTAKFTQLTGTPPRAWRDAVADYITRCYSKK